MKKQEEEKNGNIRHFKVSFRLTQNIILAIVYDFPKSLVSSGQDSVIKANFSNRENKPQKFKLWWFLSELIRRPRIVRFHYVRVAPLLLLLCEGIIHHQAIFVSILKW